MLQFFCAFVHLVQSIIIYVECLVSVEDFVDQLLSKEAGETPCDVRTAKDLVLVLPKWFNEEKFNQ